MHFRNDEIHARTDVIDSTEVKETNINSKHFAVSSSSCAANSATYTLVGESCVRRVRNKYMLLMTCLILLAPAVAAGESRLI